MFGKHLQLARKKAGYSLRGLSYALDDEVTAQAIGKDEVARWENIPRWPTGAYHTLWPNQSVSNQDAKVVMRMLYRP